VKTEHEILLYKKAITTHSIEKVCGLPFTPSLTAKINDLRLIGAFTFPSLAFTTVGTNPESTEIALLFLVRDVEPCRKRVRPYPIAAPQRTNDAKQRPRGLYGDGYRGQSVFIGFSPQREALCAHSWSS
jgi:hypothetical protein